MCIRDRDEGLKEAFADISPITDYSGHLSLDFWTTEEYQQSIQTIEPGTRYYLIFEILLWTGCRIGAVSYTHLDVYKRQV